MRYFGREVPQCSSVTVRNPVTCPSTSLSTEIWPKSAKEIVIEEEFCHPSYDLNLASEAEATETKLLRLFSLIPRVASMPIFHGRWDPRDGMSLRTGSSAIDVDAEGLTGRGQRDFISGQRGFSGHHSVKLDDGRHRISIASPQLGKIFEGILEMKASATASMCDVLDMPITDSLLVINAETGQVLLEYPPPPNGNK
jgi:hypothetical protein